MPIYKIPIALKGNYFHKGRFALFTNSSVNAQKCFDKVCAQPVPPGNYVGKQKFGSAVVYWCLFENVNNSQLYDYA